MKTKSSNHNNELPPRPLQANPVAKYGLKKWHKVVGLLIILAVIVAGIGFASFSYWYQQNLKPVNASVVEEKVVTIEYGNNYKSIAKKLKEAGVIKSSRAFELYVTKQGVRGNLQAGTYKFSPSQSVERIVTMLKNGEVDTSYITVLPGKRLAEIKEAFKKSGFSDEEVAAGLQADQYRRHVALKDLPSGATLEGYIYPETLKMDSSSTVKIIVDAAITELDKLMTSEVAAKLTAQNLNYHQAFTLASMVEKETSMLSDRPIVAQVFLKRYKEGIMLGSDVTFIYAAKEAGVEPTVGIDSPYNTRRYRGLPPGPISNFAASSLEAIANPAPTDYLYFVAGDDGKTYYGKTEAEHEANINKYCTKLCQ